MMTEENAEILAALLESIPKCMNTAEIYELWQAIPMQQQAVIPIRTIQEGSVTASGRMAGPLLHNPDLTIPPPPRPVTKHRKKILQ